MVGLKWQKIWVYRILVYIIKRNRKYLKEILEAVEIGKRVTLNLAD